MLEQLIIENLRNIDALTFDFTAPCTVIHGGNGQGKSSILEALYFLSHGRSFRTHLSQPLQKDGTETLRIRAYCQHHQHRMHLAFEKENGKKPIIRLNGQNQISMSALSPYLPTILIDTDSHRHYAEGPKYRRQMIDWGLFYNEPKFMPLWRDYQKALLQRNHALKMRQPDQHWRQILVEKGEAIHRLRQNYLKDWQPILCRLWQETLLHDHVLSIEYDAGWQGDLAEAMVAHQYSDQKLGHTQCGPHRADCRILVDAHLIHRYLSQGQQKLIGTLVALSHIEYLHQKTGQSSLCLVDDLAAELDQHTRATLLKLLTQSPSQLIITSISSHTAEEASQFVTTKILGMDSVPNLISF
jgi:DNA replication and repair protein RecF